MKIKNLELDGKTILAPLAGITNLPFRMIAKKWGCSLVCTEMISSKGLLYNSEKTFRLLDSKKEERPLCVQIFGADPDSMAEAAKIIEQKNFADIIDINFGCSVKKIVKTGAGVALMKDGPAAEKLIKAVRNAISMPFTIKIRSGFDISGDQAIAIGEIAEHNGVDAIAIHPRTASQGFKGKADWHLIKRLKQHLKIPVIGNGDIITGEDGIKMLEETGCDAIMIGRAAMGNPCIFSEVNALLKRNASNQNILNNQNTSNVQNNPNIQNDPNAQNDPNEDAQNPDHADCASLKIKFKIIRDLLFSYIDYFGEEHGCRMLRGRLVWCVKSLPGASGFRRDLSRIQSKTQAQRLISDYENFCYDSAAADSYASSSLFSR